MTELVFAPDARLEGITVSAVGLAVTDPSLSYEAFERAVGAAGRTGDTARWWLGDLLLFGEARYGEQYAQALEAARLSERQLNRYRWVCERVARSRRRENLPFSYHEEVAALDPSGQESLLSRAEAERWPREQLREAVRDARALAGAPQRTPAAAAPPQEVLPTSSPSSGAVIDAARGLSTVREVLVLAGGHLEDGFGAADLAERLPRALRALDEAGATIRHAAASTGGASLVDVARRVVSVAVKQTALADPAYIVPADALEELASLVADDD
jgi:hypothetical protein